MKHWQQTIQTEAVNQKGDSLLNNTLFVTAREIAEELGISKPFAYKLVRQMNEELEAKGFLTIARRVSWKLRRKVLWNNKSELEGKWQHGSL